MAKIGGGQEPGFFGQGSYNVDSVDIDKNAFYNDPNKKNNQQAQSFIQAANDRQGPQAQAATLGSATLANGADPSHQFRQGQAGLVGQLTAAANGQGPSLATMQLNQGNAAGAASRLAAAASE